MSGLEASLQKMRNAGMPDVALKTFAHYYKRLREGDAGMLPESALAPVDQVANGDDLPRDEAAARDALRRTIVLKLNGGLGTSMGLKGPKSLLVVKQGLTFLDLIARQILSLRRRYGRAIPLVLMNSFATEGDTQLALERHPDLAADVARTFVQSSFPKLWPEDLTPVTWSANPALEWAPPGHGDLYISIGVSGVLRQLLSHGYRYAFVSNSDNLGATLDERILAWFAGARIPFLMEVADRTEADRKGGHLARLRGDGLVLRERAQTPEGDVDAFQDIARHRFFNTNNLWLDLQALADLLDGCENVLELPLIVNRKPVDPSDPSTPEAIQLESAMGAAIGVFEGAQALRVPRRRFAPVKTTDDLLAVRSDAYVLTEAGQVELARERGHRPPVVELDPRFYKLLPDFDARFPAGPPSLVACQRLRIIGDVRFGRGVVIRGTVTIEYAGDGQLQIDDGAMLDGKTASQTRSGPLALGRPWPKALLDPLTEEDRMGFKLENVDSVWGATMVDKEGARLGKVKDVFLDRHTGRPAWAAVATGLFGRRQTLVPITDAFLNFNAEVQVPFGKDRVKEAPNIEPSQELTPELERKMWEHYGMTGYEEWQGDDRTRGLGLPDDAEDAASRDGALVMVRLRRIVVAVGAPVGDD